MLNKWQWANGMSLWGTKDIMFQQWIRMFVDLLLAGIITIPDLLVYAIGLFVFARHLSLPMRLFPKGADPRNVNWLAVSKPDRERAVSIKKLKKSIDMEIDLQNAKLV